MASLRPRSLAPRTSVSPAPENSVSRIRASRGFTLVEMLVVVGIIGIVVSLLFPAVSSMGESANRAKCSSNLKQIATGIFAYAADNNQTLPGPVYRGVISPASTIAGNTNYLSFFIQPYLPGKDTNSVWKCPSNTRAFNANAAKLVYMVNTQTSTYQSNFFGSKSSTPDDPPKTLPQVMAANSSDTSTNTALSLIWMVADIDSVNYTGSVGSYALPSTVIPPHRVKGVNGRNYAFFDGHVEYRGTNNSPANP